MSKQIIAIAFIFVCTSIAWVILGGTTELRTSTQDGKLKNEVRALWGTSQQQKQPSAYYETERTVEHKSTVEGVTKTEERVERTRHPILLESSVIDVALDLEHRRKGLLWYATYGVDFSGEYVLENPTAEPREIIFEYQFPNAGGVYDNFVLSVDGDHDSAFQPVGGVVSRTIALGAGEKAEVTIGYHSRGMGQWWYTFGENVSQIRNFDLTMRTNFSEIDFPTNSMSPTEKEATDDGWELSWKYSNLISGIQIGMIMPQKLNPGPFVSRVSFFAPVSLFLFFFLIWLITAVRGIKLHPMNYFFLAGAFFSFHLLLAYLVDHINIHLACAISSVVSIGLVVSYMRLVVGPRFALVEAGLSQFVYLVLFSYAFFLEGYTGLTITICCILTLFVVMQITGRIDWGKQFAGMKQAGGSSSTPGPPPPVA